jgi:hypothetical protein
VRSNTNSLAGLSVLALSNCGFVSYNAPATEDVLKTAMTSLSADFGAARDWRGLQTAPKNHSEAATAERLKAVLEGRDRSPGLDLLSHCGSVVLHYEK